MISLLQTIAEVCFKRVRCIQLTNNGF